MNLMQMIWLCYVGITISSHRFYTEYYRSFILQKALFFEKIRKFNAIILSIPYTILAFYLNSSKYSWKKYKKHVNLQRAFRTINNIQTKAQIRFL